MTCAPTNLRSPADDGHTARARWCVARHEDGDIYRIGDAVQLPFAGQHSSTRRCWPATEVERGSYLFFEGDEAHSVYLVRHGWMVILLAAPDGRELVLSEMRRGDVFGENAVLTSLPR